MKFPEDNIAKFIRYKLGNPLDSQHHLRMYNLQMQYDRRLSLSLLELESQRNRLAFIVNEYDDLKNAKKLLMETVLREGEAIDQDSFKIKEIIETNIKRKQQLQRVNKLKLNEYQNKKHQIIEKLRQGEIKHQQAFLSLSIDLNALQTGNAEKMIAIESLHQTISRRKELAETIFFMIQDLRVSMQSKDAAEEEMQTNKLKFEDIRTMKKKETQRSSSMQKVVYGRFYERSRAIVAETTTGLSQFADAFKTQVTLANVTQRTKIVKQRREQLRKKLSLLKNKYKTGEDDEQQALSFIATKINASQLTSLDIVVEDLVVRHQQSPLSEQLRQEQCECAALQEQQCKQQQENEQLRVQLAAKLQSINQEIMMVKKKVVIT